MGGGSVCVVPGCNNVGLHVMPKDSNRRSLWIKAMKLEGQILKKYPAVCTLHFKETDYVHSDFEPIDPRRRNLKRHAVPSIFSWNGLPLTKESTFIPVEGLHSLSDSESQTENLNPRDPLLGPIIDDEIDVGKQSLENLSVSSDMEDCVTLLPFSASGIIKTYSKTSVPIKFISELPYQVTGIATDNIIKDPLCVQESYERQETFEEDNCLAGFNIDVANNIKIDGVDIDVPNNIEIDTGVYVKQEENVSDNMQNSAPTKSCKTCGHIPFFSVHSYKYESNGIHFYTGLESFAKLMFVFHSLGNAVNSLNYLYEKPPDHLDPLEQFCMTLLILRTHREFEDIAMTYKTSIKQVTNIFITWIRFMALQWRSNHLWVDKDTSTYYMPLDFNDTCPNTGGLIDATECPIKKPHLPTTQQITFSSYKNTNKLLIGITPSGLITDLSQCYGGSASDRQIIERSSILDKFDIDGELMVDKGLNPQDICLSSRVKVKPTLFKKGNQINPDKKVHVERIIGMLKTYKILTQAMNQTETLLASDITFVIAMLVNFRSNIMNKNA